LLAQRANDLRDVGLRVLALLTGTDTRQPEYPPNCILIAEDLTPSDTATLDRSRVVGFCTTRGGATSHVAILARSLGLPALAGIEPAALEVPNGTVVILDGAKGTLRLHASPEEVTRVRTAQQLSEERRKTDLAHALEPSVTIDGTHIEVLANIGGLNDASRISGLGGEGVGLLRSEFLFMERFHAPSEQEQFEIYKSVVEAVGSNLPSSSAPSMWAATSRFPICPFPKRTIPFWENAE
jgi:phosphoenolpyruvate-protein kinase (PTS system EI component)